MTQSIKANITPLVIKWARETAGFSSVEEVADKIGRTSDEISKWESGELKPTIAQARKASEVYHRPLATLFLPHPPMDFSILKDFRRLPDDFPKEFSPNLRFMIRQTQQRQNWLSDFLKEEGSSPIKLIGSASTKTDPTKLSLKIRGELNLKHEDIRRCTSRNEALKLWINAAEELGIFVSQAGNMQYEKIGLEEARGFVLTDEFAPFIFLNYQDAKVAQIFTLAHEIVHICLNEPGVSNLWPRGRISQDANKIETYCNLVAAELILPQNEFVPIWRKLDNSEHLNDRIEKCSKHFKVSREVIARRLLIMHIITQDEYVELAEQFHSEWLDYKSRENAKKSEGNPHPYLLKVINNGRSFSRTVLTAYQEGRISGRDTSDLLNIKLNKVSDYAGFAGLGLQFRRIAR